MTILITALVTATVTQFVLGFFLFVEVIEIEPRYHSLIIALLAGIPWLLLTPLALIIGYLWGLFRHVVKPVKQELFEEAQEKTRRHRNKIGKKDLSKYKQLLPRLYYCSDPQADNGFNKKYFVRLKSA